MKTVAWIVAISVTMLIGAAANAQEVVEQEKSYVGAIIIVGNTHTPDRFIRMYVDLYPGQVLRYPQVRLAERNLNKLNWFHVDEKNGVRPTVQIVESKGPYKDILIKVQERPNSWVTLAAWDLVLARTNWEVWRVRDAAEVIGIGIRSWRSTK